MYYLSPHYEVLHGENDKPSSNESPKDENLSRYPEEALCSAKSICCTSVYMHNVHHRSSLKYKISPTSATNTTPIRINITRCLYILWPTIETLIRLGRTRDSLSYHSLDFPMWSVNICVRGLQLMNVSTRVTGAGSSDWLYLAHSLSAPSALVSPSEYQHRMIQSQKQFV